MNRRKLIILISCLVALAAATVGAWYVFCEKQPDNGILTDEHPTHGTIYFEEDAPPADPLIVGRWHNTANPQWHKVFYDDYDGEGCYWGKEWDEKDDVNEEDLNYHGNGWFRWEKHGDTLRLFATMDARDVPIARVFRIRKSTEDSLVLVETAYKQIYRFAKE